MPRLFAALIMFFPLVALSDFIGLVGGGVVAHDASVRETSVNASTRISLG
jgi:ABC-type transporter Mla maintaining outer membrane lipid asymmetry permease subunit MlaE